MTRAINLITNPELRAKYSNRTDVLDRVGDLQTIPKSVCSTTKQVAEFYGVSAQDINAVIYLNRSEMDALARIRQARHDDLKERLFDLAGSTKAWGEMRRNLGLATSVTNLYPKQAVLLIGFLLENSEVAKKVRELVLEDELDALFDEPEQEQYAYQMPYVIEPPVQKEQYNMSVSNETETNELTLDSRDVAEMMGKEHKHLMRDIRSYVEILGQSNFGLTDFFIESTYTTAQNKIMPCYLITKKGCDMVANKMTGSKGVLFTATYVTRFEEMENQLKSQAPVASYMIDNPIERAKMWIVEQEQKMLLETKVQEQVVVIEQKQSIIEAYAENIPDAEKRQILVNLIRNCRSGATISERWSKLYREFNMVYHKNVLLLRKNHNIKYGTNINVLDYIEYVLGMLDELYELGMKHFAVDANKIIEKQKKLYLID